MNKRGMFFVLEGGEGSGKSSIIRCLQKNLGNKNFVYTREPGGTPLGESVREILLAENEEEPIDELTTLLFMNALRRIHIRRVIRPALNEGKHVICDRFDASTYAYQIGATKKDTLNSVFNSTHKAVCGITTPDFVIFLDVPPSVGIGRVKKRAEENGVDLSVFDKKPMSFHLSVYESMLSYLKNFYSGKHMRIDSTLPFDVVASKTLGIIRSRIAQSEAA